MIGKKLSPVLEEMEATLWEKDGVITVVKDAERQQQNAQGEITILASIMRREGVKPRLFDYRKQNNEYEAERRN